MQETTYYKKLSVLFVVVLCSLDAVAAKPEPINWDYYAKNIAKPGMVEAFRKAVSCLYFFVVYCEYNWILLDYHNCC